MVKKQDEDEQETWTCMICGEENPEDEVICQSCGSYKEEPCYDAIADEDD